MSHSNPTHAHDDDRRQPGAAVASGGAGWSYSAASLARPRLPIWRTPAIVVSVLVFAATVLALLLGARQASGHDVDGLDEASLACLVECAAENRPTDRATCRLGCGVDTDVLDDPAFEELDLCYDGCRDEPLETDEVSCRLQCATDFYARLDTTTD